MTAAQQEKQFDFVVSGLSDKTCQFIMDFVTRFVEFYDGTVGGGFGDVDDDEGEEGEDVTGL